MMVRDCMTADVKLITPGATLSEAAQMMRDGDFGALPVGEGDRLVGVITDRDIAVRGVAEGKDPTKAEVRDCMSEGVLYCYEDQTIDEVVQNMGDVQVRRLPVLNRQKRLVGILSLGDVVRGTAAEDGQAEDALEKISRSEHNEVRAREDARSGQLGH